MSQEIVDHGFPISTRIVATNERKSIKGWICFERRVIVVWNEKNLPLMFSLLKKGLLPPTSNPIRPTTPDSIPLMLPILKMRPN